MKIKILDIFNYLKQNYLVFILALFVGFLSVFPQYYSSKNSNWFKGIYNEPVDDVVYYEARVKDVLDGHNYLSNPYFFEHKDGFPMQFWMPDYIVAKTIGILGFGVVEGFMFWRFFLCIFLCILTYEVFFSLTNSKGLSLSGIPLMFFALAGTYPVGFLKNYYVSVLGDFYLRLPSPAFNFVFFLFTFLFFVKFIKTGKNLYAILTTATFGLLFHFYPYYWSYFVVLFLVYGFLALTLKVKNFQFKKVSLIFVVSIIIGLPYFISTYHSSKLPFYDDSLSRLGMIHTHFPSSFSSIFIGGLLLVFLLFAFFRYKKSPDNLMVFVFSAVLSAIIVINNHVITGNNLEFSSHYFLGNMYVFIFAAFYILGQNFFELKEFTRKIFTVMFLIVVAVFSVYSIKDIVRREAVYSDMDFYRQNYASVFSWLNDNAKAEEVVYTNDDIGYFLPVYTSQNVYFSPFGILFFMSNSEVEDRFIINNYFEDFTADFIKSKQRMIFGGYYVNEYGHKMTQNKIKAIFGKKMPSTEMIPMSAINNVLKRSKEIKKNSFLEAVGEFRVDYIIWDSNKNPEWAMGRFKFLKEVFSSNGIIVYKFNK